LLSDGTPTPGLAELAAVIAPVRVRVAADGSGVRVENRRHSASTDDVDLVWILAHDGRQVARGILEHAALGAGDAATIPLPAEARAAGHAEEAHVTVQVVTRHDAPWAEAGHVVSSHQALVRD
ncbi:DUF4981 domain-containing protein, partial [Clavibacter michiganensis subsp. insidiosus]